MSHSAAAAAAAMAAAEASAVDKDASVARRASVTPCDRRR